MHLTRKRVREIKANAKRFERGPADADVERLRKRVAALENAVYALLPLAKACLSSDVHTHKVAAGFAISRAERALR